MPIDDNTKLPIVKCTRRRKAYQIKICVQSLLFNALRPRPDRRHIPHDIFRCIFLNEYVWISIKISLKFVPEGPINNIPHWFRYWLGADEATSHYLDQCCSSLLTQVCVTRPQCIEWVVALYVMTTSNFDVYQPMMHPQSTLPRICT